MFHQNTSFFSFGAVPTSELADSIPPMPSALAISTNNGFVENEKAYNRILELTNAQIEPAQKASRALRDARKLKESLFERLQELVRTKQNSEYRHRSLGITLARTQALPPLAAMDSTQKAALDAEMAEYDAHIEINRRESVDNDKVLAVCEREYAEIQNIIRLNQAAAGAILEQRATIYELVFGKKEVGAPAAASNSAAPDQPLISDINSNATGEKKARLEALIVKQDAFLFNTSHFFGNDIKVYADGYNSRNPYSQPIAVDGRDGVYDPDQCCAEVIAAEDSYSFPSAVVRLGTKSGTVLIYGIAISFDCEGFPAKERVVTVNSLLGKTAVMDEGSDIITIWSSDNYPLKPYPVREL